jgi:hypothetical protein
MMKVKMETGETADYNDAYAGRLIATGQATPVTEQADPAPEAPQEKQKPARKKKG